MTGLEGIGIGLGIPPEQLCWIGSPANGTACDRAADHKGRHSWELADTLPVETLATMLADLDGYIERRAGELAQPIIDQAQAAAAEQVREAQSDAVRQADLAKEIRRQLEASNKQMDRLRPLAREALRVLTLFIEDHTDPGSDALCAAYSLRAALGYGPTGTTDGLTSDRLTEILDGLAKEMDRPDSYQDTYDAGWHDVLARLRTELGIKDGSQ